MSNKDISHWQSDILDYWMDIMSNKKDIAPAGKMKRALLWLLQP